jgi:uncharacterized membrane protein SirB2
VSLLEICQRIQDSAFGTALLESQYAWLVIESIHVLSLSVSVGLLAITDLRLIGRFRTQAPVSDILRELRPWMLGGFVVMFVSGALLFWSEAATVYVSPWFRLKMLFLAVAGANALIFEASLGRRLIEWNDRVQPPLAARLAGWTSLVCWAAVIALGRWVAYAHT